MTGRLLSLDCIMCNSTHLGSNHNPLTVMNKWLILTADTSLRGFETVDPGLRLRGEACLRHCLTGRGTRAFFALCCVSGRVVAAAGQRWVSPRVLSSACEAALSVGPLSCSTLIGPLLLQPCQSWTAPLSAHTGLLRPRST